MPDDALAVGCQGSGTMIILLFCYSIVLMDILKKGNLVDWYTARTFL